jgi:hypothetical protein
MLCDQGLSRTTKQLARATETVRLMRKLSEQLRDEFSSALGPEDYARPQTTRATE